MAERFEVISVEELTYKTKEGYHLTPRLIVFRDKQTGVMYVYNEGTGISPLVDKEGKPLTTFKVKI